MSAMAGPAASASITVNATARSIDFFIVIFMSLLLLAFKGGIGFGTASSA
jgi:hypothetical protein